MSHTALRERLALPPRVARLPPRASARRLPDASDFVVATAALPQHELTEDLTRVVGAIADRGLPPEVAVNFPP